MKRGIRDFPVFDVSSYLFSETLFLPHWNIEMFPRYTTGLGSVHGVLMLGLWEGWGVYFLPQGHFTPSSPSYPPPLFNPSVYISFMHDEGDQWRRYSWVWIGVDRFLMRELLYCAFFTFWCLCLNVSSFEWKSVLLRRIQRIFLLVFVSIYFSENFGVSKIHHYAGLFPFLLDSGM